MIEKEKEGIRWLEFELLQEERCHLAHAVFLRHGGVSQKPYDSLNLGGGSGDDPSLVAINRQRVLSVLPSSDPVSGYQVHGDHIEVVRKGWNFEGGCDGLITEEKKRSLMIKHADCQAAIFYDPMQRRLANVHCGWRGNVQNIYQKTVEKMKALGSKEENILVCISPSLGPKWAEFVNYEQELLPSFLEFRVGERHFDLWEISRNQLIKAGVLDAHIEIAKRCTYENSEDYFSYRRDKVTGRLATVAVLC